MWGSWKSPQHSGKIRFRKYMVFLLKEFWKKFNSFGRRRGLCTEMQTWQLQEYNLCVSGLPGFRFCAEPWISTSIDTIGKVGFSPTSTCLLHCLMRTPELLVVSFLCLCRELRSLSALQIQSANAVISVNGLSVAELVSQFLNYSPIFPSWAVSKEYHVPSEKAEIFLKGRSWIEGEYSDER